MNAKKSHQSDHAAIPDMTKGTCVTCGRYIVLVEDSVHFAPFWRHKGVGYKWGDGKAKEERKRIVRLIRSMRGYDLRLDRDVRMEEEPSGLVVHLGLTELTMTDAKRDSGLIDRRALLDLIREDIE